MMYWNQSSEYHLPLCSLSISPSFTGLAVLVSWPPFLQIQKFLVSRVPALNTTSPKRPRVHACSYFRRQLPCQFLREEFLHLINPPHHSNCSLLCDLLQFLYDIHYNANCKWNVCWLKICLSFQAMNSERIRDWHFIFTLYTTLSTGTQTS